MKKTITCSSFWLLVFLTITNLAYSQKQTLLDKALRYAEQQRDIWGLTSADMVDMIVSDNYQTRHNGVSHFYFIQRYAGIEVHNAILGIHIKANGDLGFATNRFTPDLASKINTTEPQLSAYEALALGAEHVGLPIRTPLRLINKISDRELIYEGGEISHNDIKVKLVYTIDKKSGKARLSWDMAIAATDSPDYWSLRVDALTGAILERTNWTVYCSFGNKADHVHDASCIKENEAVESTFVPVKEALMKQNLALTTTSGATYNVFPVPVESPIHGDRQQVADPSDPTASPFGWHDTNNMEGAEYTITQGNNVHAYLDSLNNNMSVGGEPDGGVSLQFDFPLDLNLEPRFNRDPNITQLFYMNNVMHDFTYGYGFDEQAGNFQQNNYGHGGQGTDYVRAEAQDGSGTDNANFSTPSDGGGGRMQMYLWGRGGGRLLTVVEPEAIAGMYETSSAQFGPAISTTPLTGQVVNAYSSTGTPELGCGPIANASEVAGKIAMVTRGSCYFEEKAVNVEAAGAIACIICNYDESLVGMAGIASVPDPTIPTVMLKNSACTLIRALLNSEEVTVTLVAPEQTGPSQLDGDLDNGVMAHEYGHGISNRLTGGPSQASCLTNDEQMGEGWSDFFALVTTVEPGDNGAQPRGIGNYVTDGGITGGGIRRLPYSNDMTINTQTYDDIIGTTSPHQLGEIWAGTLWDLYWAMVDVYGWDPDLYHGSGGNNKAIQLVMDGMKLQTCNPGLIDGRDAIIAADQLDFEGANECLIWNVFARRGMGYSSLEGDNNNRNDGFQAFDGLPECIKELKIAKSVTPNIDAGDEITIKLVVTNHKEADVTGVIVKDKLPNGLTYVAGSTTNSINATVGTDEMTFDIGTLTSGSSLTFQYRVRSSPDLKSLRQFFDDMENGEDYWAYDIVDEGANIWNLVTTPEAHSGDYAWYVESTPTVNDQQLFPIDPIHITGTHPIIRFFHKYDTEPGIDGGILQISTNGGDTWMLADPYIFRAGYRGRINYSTFAIPYAQAYWGNSNGYIETYLDMTDFIGQDVIVRFRFGTDEEADGVTEGTGWYMDDFEILDMFNYDGEVCVTSSEGDQACTTAPGKGTIVNSDGVVSTHEPSLNDRVKVYPNPARDVLNIAFTEQLAGNVNIEVVNADGRILLRQTTQLNGEQVIPVAIHDLAAGFYFVKIRTANGTAVEKVVIR